MSGPIKQGKKWWTGHKRFHITAKRFNKTCFWKRLRWEIRNTVTEIDSNLIQWNMGNVTSQIWMGGAPDASPPDQMSSGDLFSRLDHWVTALISRTLVSWSTQMTLSFNQKYLRDIFWDSLSRVMMAEGKKSAKISLLPDPGLVSMSRWEDSENWDTNYLRSLRLREQSPMILDVMCVLLRILSLFATVSMVR